MAPLFGQLRLENVDITRNLSTVNISVGDTIDFQCADGYELVITDSNMALGSQSITITCTDGGTWLPEDINSLTCVKESGKLITINQTMSCKSANQQYWYNIIRVLQLSDCSAILWVHYS